MKAKDLATLFFGTALFANAFCATIEISSLAQAHLTKQIEKLRPT
jgi:hypothetical protein